MKTTLATLAVAALAAPATVALPTLLAAPAQAQAQTQEQTQDQPAGSATATVAPASGAPQISGSADFVQLAVSANRFEIQSSRIARDRATSPAVQDFARRMVEDHKAAGDRMADAVLADGVEMPKTMSRTHAAQLQALTDTSGEAFDAAYIEAQIGAHEEAVALFAACAQSCDDGQVKALAAELLPTLQEHLDMARKLMAE